jgi:hypothetical protein
VSFRDVLVVLRAYPATTPTSAVEHAAATALALKSSVSVIACGVIPQVPRSILGNAIFDVSALVAEEGQKSVDDARRLLAVFEEVARKHRCYLHEDPRNMPTRRCAPHPGRLCQAS